MGDELFDLRHQPDWRARQEHDVESVLSDGANSVWVAQGSEAVVGFVGATIRPEDDMGEILMLAVDPSSQGQGLGTMLTEVATDWISESGCPSRSSRPEATPEIVPPARPTSSQTYVKAGYRELPIANYFKAL